MDDRPDDRMCILIADGQTAREIADELGITRNAVCGRMWRTDLKSKNPPYRNKHRKSQSNSAGLTAGIRSKQRGKRNGHDDRGATQRVKAKANGSAAPISLPPMKASLAEYNAAIPAEQRVTIVQLENYHCRFPLWGEDAKDGFYCGAPDADMAAKIPYCFKHSEIAGAGYSRDRSYGFNRSANTFR